MQPISCPYCGRTYTHALSHRPMEDYPNHFKQGCFFAMVAHCEANPLHLFTILVGEHKGQILLDVLKAI